MSYQKNKYVIVSQNMNQAQQLDPRGNLGLEERINAVFGYPDVDTHQTIDTSYMTGDLPRYTLIGN